MGDTIAFRNSCYLSFPTEDYKITKVKFINLDNECFWLFKISTIMKGHTHSQRAWATATLSWD